MRLTDRQLTDLEGQAARLGDADGIGNGTVEMDDVSAMVMALSIKALVAEVRGMRSYARPIDAWTEEDGPALWWKFPIEEPPYSGTPLDDDFPDYVTHWTALVLPILP